MKILYIGHEHRAATMAARALHGIAPNVTLTWARTPGSALPWLQKNCDTAAVIVEVQAQNCGSFVEQVRDVLPTTPVVVVAGSAQLETALATLNAGADGYLLAGPSLEADLPRIVTLAIGRERTRGQPLTRKLAELEAERDRAEQQFARAEEARHQTEQRSASDLAEAATRFADLQAQLTASRTREARICTALQERLLELERALRNAEERSAADVAKLADQLAQRHAEFTATLTHSMQARDALAARLSVATAAIDEAQQARRADAAAAAEYHRRREAELGAVLTEEAAARTALEAALAEADAAHRDTQRRADIDRAAATERQAALEEMIVEEAHARSRLEHALAAAEATHQEAQERQATELARGAAQLAGVQAQYEAARSEHATLERHATEVASALERARQEAAASAEQFARREDELGARLAEARAAIAALEMTLTETQDAHQETIRRSAADLASAAERHAAIEHQLTQETNRTNWLEQQLSAAEAKGRETDRRHAEELTAVRMQLAAVQAAATRQEAELVERLTRESAAHAALERDLGASRQESADTRRRLLHVAAAYRRRGLEQKSRLEAQIIRERAEADRERRATHEEIQKIHLERETLQRSLCATQDQLQHLQVTLDDERQAHEQARLASEAELQRMTGEYGQLRQSFDGLQSAFQTLEGIAGEHVAERARLEAVVADRDSQLSSQAERHQIAERAAHDAIAELQGCLQEAQETSRSDAARLRQEADALRRELDAARAHAAALRSDAERVPDLQAQLERSQKERRREFERAPYALCRCTSSGVITDANHSFVSMLGRRRVDEVRNMDFATAALDRAGDLSGLLDRTRTTRKTETIETEWACGDGRRLVVRLHALATTTGSIEIVVEDITDVRALEERLRRAQHMEAVGRLATEVAVTCDALLSDVIRGANESAAAIGHEAALRHQGERLASDATRAVSLLRQLAVYGDKQAQALEPISAHRVLQDLAPVLRRVVGDQIELVLSKSSGSFDVDVPAERLERVLVNVAGYARQRMPDGGQMRIDLATTAVGRRFVARHPRVRPGDHVLITVTEVPGGAGFRGRERGSESFDRIDVDLSALVELIGTCGGHLWMEAQPAGNMVVKIHLPKRASAATDSRSDRGGRLARWFRSAPATTTIRA